MVAEMYGRSKGCYGGRGGSMHLIIGICHLWAQTYRGRGSSAGFLPVYALEAKAIESIQKRVGFYYYLIYKDF